MKARLSPNKPQCSYTDGSGDSGNPGTPLPLPPSAIANAIQPRPFSESSSHWGGGAGIDASSQPASVRASSGYPQPQGRQEARDGFRMELRRGLEGRACESHDSHPLQTKRSPAPLPSWVITPASPGPFSDAKIGLRSRPAGDLHGGGGIADEFDKSLASA